MLSSIHRDLGWIPALNAKIFKPCIKFYLGRRSEEEEGGGQVESGKEVLIHSLCSIVEAIALCGHKRGC